VHGDRENTDEELIAYYDGTDEGWFQKTKGVPSFDWYWRLSLSNGMVHTAEASVRRYYSFTAKEIKVFLVFPYRSLLFLFEMVNITALMS